MRPFNLDRRMLKNMDWLLFIAMVIVLLLSLVMVYSASLTVTDDPFYYIKRHAIFICVGLVAYAFGLALDYTFLQRFAKTIYGIMIGLLLLVLAIGEEGLYGGGQSWIGVGSISLQPSEWSKVFLVFAQAALLDHHENTSSLKTYIFSLLAMALPLFLVVISDFGTATVLVVITLGMLLIYETPWKYLLMTIGAGLSALPFLWKRLSEYQQARLTVFIDLEGSDPRYSWQLVQSLIAIGSGGLWGTGYLQGAQTQLSFLPEKHTDFIFATYAEEMGFVGAALLVIVYLVMIWRIFSVAQTSIDRYGRLLASGIGFMLLYHLVINVGMTLAVMPITGIPLPLVSYGTNSMIATMLGLGIVTSIGLRRTKSIF